MDTKSAVKSREADTHRAEESDMSSKMVSAVNGIKSADPVKAGHILRRIEQWKKHAGCIAISTCYTNHGDARTTLNCPECRCALARLVALEFPPQKDGPTTRVEWKLHVAKVYNESNVNKFYNAKTKAITPIVDILSDHYVACRKECESAEKGKKSSTYLGQVVAWAKAAISSS